MDGNSRGRLFGKNVLEAVFRASPDEDLFLGELLVGVDEATGRRYLFRVVDVTYGSEHREPGWAERVQVVRSRDLAEGHARTLQQNLMVGCTWAAVTGGVSLVCEHLNVELSG